VQAPARPNAQPESPVAMCLPRGPVKIASPSFNDLMGKVRDMNRWTEEIRGVLERAPTGALPLSSIGQELRRDGVILDPKDPWVISSLRESQGDFRTISFHPGPWTRAGDGEGGVSGPDDPWVVLRKSPDQGFGRGAGARARIREGVRAWAWGLDPSSPSGVARWVKANMEGGQICTALATGKS
jgi:hypothetical protein